MNFTSPWNIASKLLFHTMIKFRRLLPKKKSQAFGNFSKKDNPVIEKIYVINLDRQPARLAEMELELRHVLDGDRAELWSRTERYAAVDAKQLVKESLEDNDIDQIYTLGDQLFVEPQPLALPSQLALNSPIRMSQPEVAVARSHIDIWRKVAAGNSEYVLILEDDVWFRAGFASHLDQVWSEVELKDNGKNNFDILYLSYEEVKHGAPKTFLSNNVFKPERGLWHLSGYVISRDGAQKLLRLLPCRGPIDLWINHQFGVLDVQATRLSIISQRRDGSSTNSYSVLPSLTKIGAITSEGASLFHFLPNERPVFAFGLADSGLSSLAMALSMLGYKCCSDLQSLPNFELEQLLSKSNNRVFDAYVNIGVLEEEVSTLRKLYPQAKFFITTNEAVGSVTNHSKVLSDLIDADAAVLHLTASNKWQIVCEHLRCAPPISLFPDLADLGQRPLLDRGLPSEAVSHKQTKYDKSPWVVESRPDWQGIYSVPIKGERMITATPVSINDNLKFLNAELWFPREDTFTDNQALFRPSNVEFVADCGATLNIRKELLGVREYSAASLTSCDQYLYGRFEVVMRASNVPGVITGFFLHRNSPRQEIDIEIAGNRPDRLIINVFYNPGGEGAKFDYGYRGTPNYVDLGFDASKADHLYAIEWTPSEIRWFVDDDLVHVRVDWDPTPIPHLPMALHINAWPTCSKELAGRLISRNFPTTTFIRSIALEANRLQEPLSL